MKPVLTDIDLKRLSLVQNILFPLGYIYNTIDRYRSLERNLDYE